MYGRQKNHTGKDRDPAPAFTEAMSKIIKSSATTAAAAAAGWRGRAGLSSSSAWCRWWVPVEWRWAVQSGQAIGYMYLLLDSSSCSCALPLFGILHCDDGGTLLWILTTWYCVGP